MPVVAKTGDTLSFTLEFRYGVATLMIAVNDKSPILLFDNLKGDLYAALCLVNPEDQATLLFQ